MESVLNDLGSFVLLCLPWSSEEEDLINLGHCYSLSSFRTLLPNPGPGLEYTQTQQFTFWMSLLSYTAISHLEVSVNKLMS